MKKQKIHQMGSVWDKNHLSPTIDTAQGGYRQPMIVEMNALNPMPDGTCRTLKNQYAKNSVANFDNQGTWGASGAIETVRIKQATKEGYIECKVGGVADLSYPTSNTRRGRVQENGDVCPTLTATETGVCKIEKVGQISSDGSQCGTVVNDNGLSPNLVAGTHGYANNHILTNYRIRKLTPKECWRLMAFTDEDFHKAEAVNSNTQLYKQAGNSIVATVLEAIFRQMCIQDIKTWNEEKGA